LTELESIKKLIEENEVVSFDVFDTLLLRNILRPADIFFLLEESAKKEFEIKNFREERILAESNSRIGHENNETTIDDIYKELEKKFHKKLAKLKTKELELEKKFLTKNPFLYEVYSYAKKKKKKVFAISDMYLTKEFIQEVLKENGYELDAVYVSSENFKVKGNASLFEEVYEKEKVSKEKWLHMGDNRISDVESPRKFGIHSYHYKNVLERSGFENKTGNVTESIIKGIQQNMLFTGEEITPWKRFGITCVAPIYYGFTNWLYQMTKHTDNVYFLARDAYMIQKVYQLFTEKLNKNIDTYYLYCSRASYQIPTLIDGPKDLALDVLTRFNEAMGQKVRINSLGLDSKNYEKEFRNFRLTEDTILTKNNVYKVQKFLSYIYEDITEKLKEKRDIVVKYLEQMNMNKYDKINIVDIGWAGSTQYALSLMLKEKTITGYYFGTRKKMYENVKYNSFGYMYDSEEPEKTYKHIDENVMMYEFIFSAPHGTTLGFEEKNGKLHPILEDFKDNESAMKEFQSSALKTCEAFLKYYDELKYIENEVVLINYKEMIKNKNYQDLVMFSSVMEAVGYDGGKLPFVNTYKKEEVLEDLKSFYEKISESLWKNTFLLEGMEQEEYEEFTVSLKSTKRKIRSIIKSLSLLKILKALRYPRTTLRKIKALMKNDSEEDV